MTLEQTLDAKQLWTYSGGTNDYILCTRTGNTRKTKNGFTIPATPGNLNHHAENAFNSKKTQNGKLIFVNSPSQPGV